MDELIKNYMQKIKALKTNKSLPQEIAVSQIEYYEGLIAELKEVNRLCPTD